MSGGELETRLHALLTALEESKPAEASYYFSKETMQVCCCTLWSDYYLVGNASAAETPELDVSNMATSV